MAPGAACTLDGRMDDGEAGRVDGAVDEAYSSDTSKFGSRTSITVTETSTETRESPSYLARVMAMSVCMGWLGSCVVSALKVEGGKEQGRYPVALHPRSQSTSMRF